MAIILSITNEGQIKATTYRGRDESVEILDPQEARNKFSGRHDVHLSSDFHDTSRVTNEIENLRRIAQSTYFGLRTH